MSFQPPMRRRLGRGARGAGALVVLVLVGGGGVVVVVGRRERRERGAMRVAWCVSETGAEGSRVRASAARMCARLIMRVAC